MVSIDDADAQLEQAHAEALQAGKDSTLALHSARLVAARLVRLNQAGIVPEMMGSAVLLCNEFIRKQVENQRRIEQVISGILEMQGRR